MLNYLVVINDDKDFFLLISLITNPRTSAASCLDTVWPAPSSRWWA